MIKHATDRFRVRYLAAALVVVIGLSLVRVPQAQAIDESALLTYKQTFTSGMCKDGGSWLRCFQVDPANCSSVLAPMIERCTRLIVEKQKTPPANDDEAQAASNKIVRCIEQDFRQRYDAFKLNTEECRNL